MKKLSKLMQEALELMGSDNMKHTTYSRWHGNGPEGGRIPSGGEMIVHFNEKVLIDGNRCWSRTFMARTVRALQKRGLIQTVKDSGRDYRDTQRGWTTHVYTCRKELTEAGRQYLKQQGQ
jgi:hypothetical protein